MRPFKRLRKMLTAPVADVEALQLLAAFQLGYIPWSGSAMRPSAVIAIVNEVLVNNRKQVLELGAGISTVFTAAAIRQAGVGHLDTIEENEEWIAVVQDMLMRTKLDSYVTFHHAPMVPRPELTWPDESGFTKNYYDTHAVQKIIPPNSKQILVVDAPAAYRHEWRFARYPAYEVFRPLLAEEHTVFIDDITRDAERRACEDWAKNADVSIKLDEARRIGILATGRRWNT